MADRVIIVGVHRGPQKVGALELLQMIGRAGRKAGPNAAVATVLVDEDMSEEVEEDILKEESYVLRSGMVTHKLAFHLMAEIAEDRIKNMKQADSWAMRTFAAFSGADVDVEGAVDILAQSGAVELKKDCLVPLPIGVASSRFYFHPETVHAWKENWDAILSTGAEEDDIHIAWALANVPHYSMKMYGLLTSKAGRDSWTLLDCAGLEVDRGDTSMVVLWRIMMGAPKAREARSGISMLSHDVGRVTTIMSMLNDICGWQMEDFFNRLAIRLRYHIPDELANLCSLPGVGKTTAQSLYSMGIENRDDLEERAEEIFDYNNPRLTKCVKEALQ